MDIDKFKRLWEDWETWLRDMIERQQSYLFADLNQGGGWYKSNWYKNNFSNEQYAQLWEWIKNKNYLFHATSLDGEKVINIFTHGIQTSRDRGVEGRWYNQDDAISLSCSPSIYSLDNITGYSSFKKYTLNQDMMSFIIDRTKRSYNTISKEAFLPSHSFWLVIYDQIFHRGSLSPEDIIWVVIDEEQLDMLSNTGQTWRQILQLYASDKVLYNKKWDIINL